MNLWILWTGFWLAFRCSAAFATPQPKPLHEKVFEAPAALIEFLRKDNQKQGIKTLPQPVNITSELRRDIVQALQGIPKVVLNKIGDNFEGIYLVKDLGGSGYTEYSLDNSDKIATIFTVLDAEALNRAANDWITWKENSPFIPDPTVKLTAKIARRGEDNKQGALQFIVLHELGHVIGLQKAIHPPWGKLGEKQFSRSYPFFNLSWMKRDRKIERKAKEPLSAPLVYYFDGKDKPTAREIPKFYDWLEKTDFPTLYAATSSYDDFAESLATYVHTKLLGKPFEITFEEKGKGKRTYLPCWDQERCAAKQTFLAKFLSESR
jgi:hypothetical protein